MMIMLVCPITFGPFKGGSTSKMCCNSYTFTGCGCKIKAESLLLKYILIVSFKIHCGGLQSQNYENGVNVQIFMDPTVYVYIDLN